MAAQLTGIDDHRTEREAGDRKPLERRLPVEFGQRSSEGKTGEGLSGVEGRAWRCEGQTREGLSGVE
jgi:hypothetical protein